MRNLTFALFGVSSVSAGGSRARSSRPSHGGAFKTYIVPEEKK